MQTGLFRQSRLDAYREAISRIPEPRPGADAIEWADRDWQAAIDASRTLASEFLATLPPEREA